MSRYWVSADLEMSASRFILIAGVGDLGISGFGDVGISGSFGMS